MSSSVFYAVARAVRDRGPITFADYMDLALYGRGGYYEHPPVGPRGDFVTGPHVHPVFGQLVAEALRSMWEAIGRPAPCALIEAGAGDGTLMRQLLPELADLPMHAVAVERSAGARAALASIKGVDVRERTPATGAAVVLAHELLDNLGFRRVRGTDDGPREVRITVVDGAIAEVLTPAPDLAAVEPEAGQEALIPEGAISFVLDVLRSEEPRALLAIDYGGERGAGGEVHGYRGHRVVEDVLDDPGAADITAGVDFGAIREAVTTAGFHTVPTVTQREALLALGFEPWLRTQLERQSDLLGTGRGADAVRAWGGRSRATMLVDPAGLGRFRWFVATNVELVAPPWLIGASGGEV